MSVLRVSDTGLACLQSLFSPYGLNMALVDANSPIPGSHWGDDEAGLIQHTLYARNNTPVHSVCHEACHWLLMDEQRRAALHTDAGGSVMEENAVCYLQIVLSTRIPGMGMSRMFSDMDAWGYSFRLGSAQRWFENDADDARAFLHQHTLVRSGQLSIDVPMGNATAAEGK